jgi:hypothetical protein
MLSLIGPAHTANFGEGSRTQIQIRNAGGGGRGQYAWHDAQQETPADPLRLANCTIYDNRRDRTASKIRELFQ